MNHPMKTGSPSWQDRIIRGAEIFGISISADHCRRFAVHGETLLEWNRKTNLTAITDPSEMAEKHFLDSIIPVRWIPPGSRILDVGTGGGFPGIPLKIVEPTLDLTLIDAKRKKISFLQHLIRCLGLTDTRAVHIRSEALAAQASAADAFDVIISRALSAAAPFAASVLPLLKPGGRIIAMKGAEKEAGIEAPARKRNLSVRETEYRLPYSDARRSILVFENISKN